MGVIEQQKRVESEIFMLSRNRAKAVQNFDMNRNWALSFVLADKQQTTLSFLGDIGFGFGHIAHRAARQTSRTQSPVRKRRVFYLFKEVFID